MFAVGSFELAVARLLVADLEVKGCKLVSFEQAFPAVFDKVFCFLPSLLRSSFSYVATDLEHDQGGLVLCQLDVPPGFFLGFVDLACALICPSF